MRLCRLRLWLRSGYGAVRGGEYVKTRHKWMLAVALLIAIVAWFAWTWLTAASDVGMLPR